MPDPAPAILIAQRTAQFVRGRRQLGIAKRRHRVPRAQYPKLVESDYAKVLVEIATRSRAALEPLLVALPGMIATAAADRGVRLDQDEARRTKELLDRGRRVAFAATDQTVLEGVAERAALQVSTHQREQLARQTKAALGVELMTLDQRVPAMIKHFVGENVALIKSLAGRPLDEIEKLVTRAFTEGTRHEDVAAEIARRYQIAERHARLIARDQVAKLLAQVARARHREIGLSSFRWRTMRDPKVRPQHQAREGVVYRYDKPHPVPGQEVLCRCQEEPVFDDILALLG